MKKILSIMLCMFLLFSACPVQNVNAEGTEYQYYMQTNEFDGFWFDINLNIPTNTNIYAYYVPSGPSYMMLCIVDDSVDEYYYSSLDGNCLGWRGGIDISNIVILSKSQLLSGYYNGQPSSIGSIYVSNNSAYTTNIPCFDNYDSFLNYLSTGNTDGWLNKPETNYGTTHDFSKDEYSLDIPLPQLSSISHTGFKINNLDNYFVDIVAEYAFCGKYIDVDYGADRYWFTDYKWKYRKHTYDFTQAPFAVDVPIILIDDLFGVDAIDLYWNDFAEWSAEYNDIQKLPSYNWTAVFHGDTYKNTYVLSEDRLNSSQFNGDKSAYLSSIQMLHTTFYVRFYDENGNHGQWVRYTFNNERGAVHESLDVSSGTVTSGAVTGTNINGSPIVNESYTGIVDTNANVDYTSSWSDNSSGEPIAKVEFEEFNNTLNSFSDGVGQLPDFIARVFSFLPWWVNGMIAAVIVIAITLRVLGR